MITLYKAYPYDNKYDYVKTFGSKQAQATFFNSLSKINIDDTNYIKVQNSFNVNYDYDYLDNEGVNYVVFNNGYRDIYAFIIKKEYIREEVTRIIYEVDVIQTYMFDFSIGESFIERKVCEISEITDFDEGLEMGEHEVEYDFVSLDKNYRFFAMFTGFKDYFVNTDGTNYLEMPLQDASRPITTIDGIKYPLLFIALEDEFITGVFYKHLIDLPNLVGIIRMPYCSYTKSNLALPFIEIKDGKIIKNHVGVQYVANNITSLNISGEGVSVPKSEITDFFPYTYYVLTDGECEPLIIQPQYCGDSINIVGTFALSHQPIERYYPTYYKGSKNGHMYNITNTSVMMLPCGTNGGIEILQANVFNMEQQEKANKLNAIISSGMAGVSLATGNVTGTILGMQGAFNSVYQNIARKKDIELTPSSIKSYGTPSTRKSFNLDSVRIVKYTIQEKYKERINKFVKRYGNKFNNFDTIDLKSYKGFIKFSSPDINSKIDNIYIDKIIEILERGVYVE